MLLLCDMRLSGENAFVARETRSKGMSGQFVFNDPEWFEPRSDSPSSLNGFSDMEFCSSNLF